MANITYVEASGQSTTISLPDGWSLMQGATANGVEGILGECGGSCACATCHCYVDASRLDDLPPPHGERARHAGKRGRRAQAQQPPGLPDQGVPKT